MTTAYSIVDSPIPTVPDDQHTLAFRILAQLPAAAGAEGPSPITTLTGASLTQLTSTSKEVRLDPAVFYEEFAATTPKRSTDKKTLGEVESATFTFVVVPAIARDLVDDATWATTAWGGR